MDVRLSLLGLLTELTAGTDSLLFINQWGCDSYFTYNQELLVYDQEKKLWVLKKISYFAY